MRIVWLSCVVLLAEMLFAESALLFKATFDGYNTAPDFAVGTKGTPGGIQPDLQMRMVPGEGAMKNVVSLTNPEFISYPLAGNFRPDRGTVSFWTKPCNYTLSDVKTFQMFFTATAPGFEFYVYKYPQRPNVALFYLRCGEVSKFVCGQASWRTGDWHKLDVTWDPNAMAIYVDGRLSSQAKFDSPLNLPRAFDSGRMALNRQAGFNPTVDGRETAYDGLEIRGRKLTAQEIFDNYRLVRPDARLDEPIAAEKEEVRLTYRCLPREAKLRVNLDLWAVEMKRRADIPAILKIVSRKSGATVCSAEVAFATPESAAELPFGDKLVEGETYDVVAEVPEAKIVSKAGLHVPDMSFLKVRAGVDAAVPPPWTPVRVDADGVYSINDRTYRFDRGILPTGIVCRGEEMLAAAPRFKLDGEPVEWERPRLVKAQDDRVVLAAQGRVGDVIVRGRADLWFDGFCQLQVRFRPDGGPVDITSLKLKWSVPRDAARYLMTPVYRAWQDDRYDGTFGEAEYAQDQFLWTTGVEKGLVWWCGSLANWVGEKDAKNLHVRLGEKQADITVDIIAKGVKLSADADYTMGFQATPAKAPDRLDRSHWYSAGGTFGDWTTGGWGIERGRPAADNMRNWTSFVPLDPKAFGNYVAKRKREGMTILSYSQPALISVRDEPWDYFNAVWSRLPYTHGAFLDLDKKPVPVHFCCGNTGAADWHANNVENLFKDYPDLGGLYFDISDVKFCSNTQHGHGGTDAFGRSFNTSTALATREYFLRVCKLCRRYGRRLHVHAHNKYYPFVHAFADSCWPGEEQYYAYANNPENHYLEGIGEEEYQAAWTPTIRGMNVYMIAQNSRASDFGDHKDKPELFFGRRGVMASMMPPLLYDFKSLGGCFGRANAFADGIFRKLSVLPLDLATFHGYWFDSHAKATKGIRTALYTWTKDGKPSFLLVVGNASRTDLKTGLDLDWSKAGREQTPLMDLISGETRTEAEWAEFPLVSHEFVLLVPTAAE